MKERLKVVSLDITYKCNFRCRHCYNSSGEHNFNNKELSDEEMIILAKEIAEYNPDSVCICGGETLLRKELVYEVGNILKTCDCSYNIVTNGYLMTDEIANKLKKSGYSLVQVSIDGLKENYEWLRGVEGGFEKAVEAIKCVKRAGLMAAVSCVPLSRNVNDVEKIIEMCDELGVESFRMQPLMQLGRAGGIDKEFVIQDGYVKIIDTIQRYRSILRDRGSRLQLEWGDPIEHLITIGNGNTALGSLHLSAYGEILVSPYIPLSIGSVRKHTFSEYLEANLLDDYNTELIRKIVSLVQDEQSLDVHEVDSNIPAIFTGENLELDYLDLNYEEKSAVLCEKYFK